MRSGFVMLVRKRLKEKQLRAQCAIVSVSVCNCGSFLFTRHASRPGCLSVSKPTLGPTISKSCNTYPPAIGEFETSRSQGLVRLSTQVSCEAAVAVHHCKHTFSQPSAVHCAICPRAASHCNISMPVKSAAFRHMVCLPP